MHKITAKTIHKQINMTLEHKKYIFIELGKFLSQFLENESVNNPTVLHNDLFFNEFLDLIKLSQSHNGWYTPEQVYFSIQSWASALTADNLNQWLASYDFKEIIPKTVGLILAGNIPLVGFHDFLSVLITGHKVLVKTSSNDQHLLPFLAKYIISVEPKMENHITFVEGKLENFDAVIATGSNNTARYFEYYFKDKPSIIRKSRNSVAVLNGQESKEQMIALGEDVFRYFGLGCRNVSKIFIPKDYNFDSFFNGMFPYQDVIKYEKYANNYDYNKAVFLMSNFNLLDNEFLIIKEDASYASPISSVFYEFYDSLDEIKTRLAADKEQIQCIVSNNLIENSIAFGHTQKPNLWDYADNIDTIDFLIRI
ncbi:MAG TPA: acyl-CoA reductase [Flavobacterium sp.]|nr:acyl-CoA reductase [Flavobacterium sp.]